MSTLSPKNISIPDEQTRTSRRYRAFALALALLLGAGLFIALISLVQPASAYPAANGQPSDALTASGPSASPDCGPDWTVYSSPNNGTGNNHLQGVDALSSDDAWAVGYYNNGTVNQTLVEHWNGTSWIIVFSPNMGALDNELYSVTAISSNNVWAVGYRNSDAAKRTLIEHWNGTAWSVVASQNANTNDNRLSSVAAIAANDVWAVGYYSTGSILLTLTEHWNGTSWIIVFSPNVGTGSNYLNAVDAISSDDVWAVGESLSPSTQTLTEHWNGTSWSVVPSPNVGTDLSHLEGVSALSTGDVWAVGYSSDGSTTQTLTEHWNGTDWSIISSPSPGQAYNGLNGVAALSSGNAWAVGYHTSVGPYHTLVEHWGGSWSIYTSPDPSATTNWLYDVAAASSNDVWAVGHRDNDSGYSRTLILRYNPCTGSPTPTLTPGGPTATPTAIPSQCTLQFEDVPNPSTFYTYVRCLACRGIINGYPCGGLGEPCNPTYDPYFRPNNNVTRGQIAKIVALSASINNPVVGQTFEDVPPASTFYTYTEQLYALDVMNGYQCGGPGEPCNPPANRPYFRPNANATRGQLAKIDSNAVGYNDTPTGQTFEDVPPASTFYTYIQRLTSRGVMNGYACGNPEPCVPPGNMPYFRPNANVTRGQTSKIVANTFYPDCQTPAQR